MSKGKKNTMTLGVLVLALITVDVAFAQTYYGSQLMTPQERAEHRAMMRSLSPNEREAYRAQQHEAMKKRAESMGLSLPDQPPTYGRQSSHRGPGYGYGRGRPGYWGPSAGGAGPQYGDPGYGGWRGRGGYGPGSSGWGPPTW